MNAGLQLCIWLAIASICAEFVSSDDSQWQQPSQSRTRYNSGRNEGLVGRGQRGRFGGGRQTGAQVAPNGRRRLPLRVRTTTPPSHISLAVPPDVRIVA